MENLIILKNLEYEIPYSGPLFEKLNLEVGAKEFVGLIGPNGSGKTTLLDLILGFKSPTSGEVLVLGENPYQRKRLFKNQIAYFSQDICLKGDLRVSDFLEFHSRYYSEYSKLQEKRLLDLFELSPIRNIGSLSTGQQKKVQFVAGLATQPKLIIVDEVTAVLDPIGRRTFFQELARCRDEENATIILATNIAEDLSQNVDRIIFLKDKHLLEAKPDQVQDLFEGRVA